MSEEILCIIAVVWKYCNVGGELSQKRTHVNGSITTLFDFIVLLSAAYKILIQRATVEM